MGRWLACSPLPGYASMGQVGIELGVQFNYFKLLRVNGELLRSTAPSEPGIWAMALFDTGEWKVVLSDDTGVVGWSFIVYSTPPMLRLGDDQHYTMFIR